MLTFQNRHNPILPVDFHIPDSEAHMMPDGRLYIYGSYDEGKEMFCSGKYYVVSTPDMKRWTIHNISFTTQDIPWLNDPDSPKYPGVDWYHPTPFLQKMIAKMMKEWKELGAEIPEAALETEKPVMLFAPDCIHRDGKYYLYFCLSDDREGVAVSDRPEGPFGAPVQLPCGGIDPAIFVDDDGQAYYYWGQISSHGVKLNQDMVSFRSEDVVDNLLTEDAHFFHEGSSVRKIGDIYYYVFANVERGRPTALGYATGKTPLGPFEYRGIIIDNAECDPASWNNHGSIENVNGQWYVFYHRCSRSTEQYRRLCIEPISINPDGTINEVKMTSQGIGAPFAPGEQIMGYQACGVKGSVFIDKAASAESAQGFPEKLTKISAADEIDFRYVRSTDPWSQIELQYSGAGTIRIKMIDRFSPAQTFFSTISVAGSAGEIKSGKGTLIVPAGEYELKLVIEDAADLEIFAVTLR